MFVLSVCVQTFSHFTWEASKHNLVVVDIQVCTPDEMSCIV
jgi:hypothetical protein